MSSKKISPLRLAFTSFVLGAMLFTIYHKAMMNGDLLTALIITITNFVVFIIAAIALVKMRKQISEKDKIE